MEISVLLMVGVDCKPTCFSRRVVNSGREWYLPGGCLGAVLVQFWQYRATVPVPMLPTMIFLGNQILHGPGMGLN